MDFYHSQVNTKKHLLDAVLNTVKNASKSSSGNS